MLATGSQVSPVPLPALTSTGLWTTDDALDADRVPESMIILGGGATAVEFATYYAGLGRRVSLIQRSPHLLSGSDEDVSDALCAGLRGHGVEVFTGTRLLDAQRTASGKCVSFEHDGQTKRAEAEQMLHAMGRCPAVSGLNLEKAIVKLLEGRLEMKPTQQTSQPHIFAAGDASGPHEIVHIAIQQSELATRNAARWLQGSREPQEEIDYRLKVFAIFSEPEVAMCGATERELREANVPFRSAKYPFNDHGKSMCIGETDGFVKLIGAPDSGEILGAAVVGPHASELIHEIVVLMSFRGTAKQLAATPHYHPTLSEIWTYPAEELAE
jgi:pyruvate/2-oxoglutarate dehydrogenase complex dihydrolipoamide dehydrogenase (E3) component